MTQIDAGTSPGVIAPLALRQLAAKQVIARDWPVVWASANDAYSRCYDCGLAILRVRDGYGQHYNTSHEEILALTVAHISIHHPEVFNGID